MSELHVHTWNTKTEIDVCIIRTKEGHQVIHSVLQSALSSHAQQHGA